MLQKISFGNVALFGTPDMWDILTDADIWAMLDGDGVQQEAEKQKNHPVLTKSETLDNRYKDFAHGLILLGLQVDSHKNYIGRHSWNIFTSDNFEYGNFGKDDTEAIPF